MTNFTTAVNSSVLLEISGFNSCHGDSRACITWLTTGPFEGSKGGVLGFKMLSACNDFVSLGSTMGNGLGLMSRIMVFCASRHWENPLTFVLRVCT